MLRCNQRRGVFVDELNQWLTKTDLTIIHHIVCGENRQHSAERIGRTPSALDKKVGSYRLPDC